MTAVSVAHTFKHFQTGAMSMIYAVLLVDLDLSLGAIGIISATQNATAGYLQGASGFLTRYFPRRVIMGVGHVILGVTTLITGTANSLLELVGYRGAFGAAHSTHHPIGTSIISDGYSSDTRGKALGIHISAGHLGQALAPILVAPLILFIGWRGALAILALPSIILGVGLFLLLGGSNPIRLEGNKRRVAIRPVLQLFRQRNITITVVAQMVLMGGRGFALIATFFPIYMIQGLGFPLSTTGVLFSIVSAGGIVAPLIFGPLSDRIGRKRIILISVALVTPVTAGFLTFHDPLSLAVLLGLFGIFSFAIPPVLQSFLADVSDSTQRDMTFGLFFTLGFGIVSVWIPVFGFLIEAFGFSALFVGMMVLQVAGGGIFALAKEKEPKVSPRAERKRH